MFYGRLLHGTALHFAVLQYPRAAGFAGAARIKNKQSDGKSIVLLLFRVVGKKWLLFLNHATFLDTCFLTGEITQVVKLGATHFTVLVDGDRVDKRRFQRENTLNANIVAHLAHCEALLFTVAGDADYYAAILLDTFLVTFFDAVSNGYGVARSEFGMCFAGSISFLDNFD